MQRFDWDLYAGTKGSPLGAIEIFEDRVPTDEAYDPPAIVKLVLSVAAFVFMVGSVAYSFYSI